MRQNAIYTFPNDFETTQWQRHEGTAYVSALGSDTEGNGSPRNPYKTIDHACSLALEGDVVVVGPGVYAEAVDVRGKALALVADGEVVLNAQGAPCALCGYAERDHSRLEGFIIYGASSLLHGSVPLVLRCIFRQGRIEAYTGIMHGCVLDNVILDTPSKAELLSCTLLQTTDQVADAEAEEAPGIIRLHQCYLDGATRLTLQAEAMQSFDYCAMAPGATVVVDGEVLTGLASVQAAIGEWQQNGLEGTAEFLDGAAAPYTLTPGQLLATKGIQGTWMGALGEGWKWNTGVAEVEGLVEDAEGWVLDGAERESGMLETTVIDLGKNLWLGRVGLPLGVMHTEEDLRLDFDNAVRHPGRWSYRMRWATEEAGAGALGAYAEFAWGQLPLLDTDGLGNGSAGHEPGAANLLEARYVQLRVYLQQGDVFALMKESDEGLLIQEGDGDLLLL